MTVKNPYNYDDNLLQKEAFDHNITPIPSSVFVSASGRETQKPQLSFKSVRTTV